ncbi:MAG: hypothetical protein FVQ80_07555 [Planctomycetes bacterium]|nr:hypothetical protein [Planctomycetota bacterium]
MEEIKISGGEELVKAEIRTKTETYFLVTEDNLKSITGKNILTDVFSVLASLLWGAYVSVLLAKATSVNAPASTITLLQTYQNVFLVCAIIATAFAVVFLIITYIGINNIRKSSLPAT